MKKTPLLTLLGLTLVACGPAESTSSSTPTPSPSTPPSTPTSTPIPIDIAKAIAPLTEPSIAFQAELDFQTYYSMSGEPHASIPTSIESALTPTMYYFAEFDEDGYYQYVEDYASEEGYACQHALYPDNTIGELLYLDENNQYIPLLGFGP